MASPSLPDRFPASARSTAPLPSPRPPVPAARAWSAPDPDLRSDARRRITLALDLQGAADDQWCRAAAASRHGRQRADVRRFPGSAAAAGPGLHADQGGVDAGSGASGQPRRLHGGGRTFAIAYDTASPTTCFDRLRAATVADVVTLGEDARPRRSTCANDAGSGRRCRHPATIVPWSWSPAADLSPLPASTAPTRSPTPSPTTRAAPRRPSWIGRATNDPPVLTLPTAPAFGPTAGPHRRRRMTRRLPGRGLMQVTLSVNNGTSLGTLAGGLQQW